MGDTIAPSQSTPSAQTPSSLADEEHQILDLRALESARVSAQDKFVTITQFYLEDSHDYISQIEAAIEGGNPEEVSAAAHTLKSSSKLLGVVQVAELARQVEMAARAMIDEAQSNADLGVLSAALKKALEAAAPRLEEIVRTECA